MTYYVIVKVSNLTLTCIKPITSNLHLSKRALLHSVTGYNVVPSCWQYVELCVNEMKTQRKDAYSLYCRHGLSVVCVYLSQIHGYEPPSVGPPLLPVRPVSRLPSASHGH